MRSFAALLTMLIAFAAHPLAAREFDGLDVVGHEILAAGSGNERFVSDGPAHAIQGIAAFGPFRVLDGGRAALVDVTDARSPAAFASMVKAWPAIAVIEMVDCPGTEDDLANLRLGRMIRARGISTYVPAGGSVRSGAVELFVAGAHRYADPGARFAVHAWIDEDGLEATDFGPLAPQNRRYIDYYRQMGMSEAAATAFYAMTNSVPHHQVRSFDGTEMAGWLKLEI